MDLNFNPDAQARLMTPLALLPFLAASTLAPHVHPPTPTPTDTLVQRESFLMGTRLHATVRTALPQEGFAGLEAAFVEVARLERLLSTWRHDSELARLNRAPRGAAVPVHPELLQLLQEVWSWSERTGGTFDPAIGALIDAWDLRGRGRIASRLELDGALCVSGTAHFVFDPRHGTVTRDAAGAWITAGGFGKGAALRAARQALREAGVSAALLDFGGQLYALGAGPRGSGWEVGVAHPRQRQRQVARLRVADRSVATSGASERFVTIGERRLGHILDPRTGRPVEAWGSVTVVSSDPLVADIVSTALFVMGPEAGLEWALGREDLGALFLVSEPAGLQAVWTPAMDPWLVELSPAAAAPDHQGEIEAKEKS